VSPKKLGMKLKRLREARGLTQAALAARVQSSQVYIAQIEGSAQTPPKRVPSLAMLEKLAKALRVKPSTLLD
jgi:transcriptional regulator with XRE-family HTH domain